MFLDRVVHFGEILGDQVLGRSPKNLKSSIDAFRFIGALPLPDLPKFLRSGELGLGTRYGDERMIILQLRTCSLRHAT